MITLDPKSELALRADEIREAAKTCKTIRDLADHFRWSMEVARHANQGLSLNLPEAQLRPGPAKVAVACPKPVRKGAGK